MRKALGRFLAAILPAALVRAIAPPVPVPDPPKRIDLAAIQARMMRMPNQVDIPVEHVFSGGIYLRSITIPAGTLVMGKRHRGETCNILLKGKLAVYVNETDPPRIITAPAVFSSPPLTKKFAYCIEEAIFINAHPTNETDPDKIEAKVIIPEREYLEMKEAQQCLS